MNLEKLFNEINLTDENKTRFLNLTNGYNLNFDTLSIKVTRNCTYLSIMTKDMPIGFIFAFAPNYTIGQISGKNNQRISIKTIGNKLNYLRGSYKDQSNLIVTYSLYKDNFNGISTLLAATYPAIKFNDYDLKKLQELSLEKIDIERIGNYQKEIHENNPFILANQLFQNTNLINEMKPSLEEVDFGTKRNFKKTTR